MTGHSPLVSIIINNYNYGRFIPAAIDSALNQTYPNIEVIVVDDGSTDNSRDVISSYGGRITALLKENGGQGSAFNAGFAASAGDIILFLDADDIYLPRTVESAVPFFTDSSVAKVHWLAQPVDEFLQNCGLPHPAILPDGDFRHEVLVSGPSLASSPTSANAWSRWFLQTVTPIDETVFRLCADMHLFELAPFFGVLRKLETPLTLYRQHGNNNYVNEPAERKIRRELRYYDSVCETLMRVMGIPKATAEAWRKDSWAYKDANALARLDDILESGRPFILVDDSTWPLGPIGNRSRIPFIERNGQYWGQPASDEQAIGELTRQRANGASAIAFAWQSFWWFDQYPHFHKYLMDNYCCIADDSSVVIFTLSNAGQ